MSRPISSIVTISIDRSTRTPTRAGFGVPLFLAMHSKNNDRVRAYTDTQGVLDDGHEVGSAVYAAASAFVAQSPRPPIFKIGRVDAPAVEQQTFSLNFSEIPAEGQPVEVSVDGVDFSVVFTSDVLTTLGLMTNALVGASGITASDDGVTLTIVSDLGVSVLVESSDLDVLDVSGDLGYAEALSQCSESDPDFFAVACESNSSDNVISVAAWAQSNSRLAFFSPSVNPTDYSADVSVLLSTTDNAISIPTRGDRGQFLECRWMAESLPFDPGEQTWAHKTPRGAVPDDWTTTETIAIESIPANHFQTTGGVPVTNPGVTHSGEWIDVIRGVLWLEARLAESVFTALLANRKIPFSEGGLAILRESVESILSQAEGDDDSPGLIQPGWAVETTRISDLTPEQRASRNFGDIKFQARLQGAVHKLTVSGRISP